MTTKNQIFQFFSDRGIYLPAYALDKVHLDIIQRIRNKESIFTIMYDLETDKSYEKYNNPTKGAYVQTLEREKTKKSVIGTSKENGEEIKFDSLYAAAVWLGKGKDAAGNIAKAAKGRTNSVYGYTWRWT